MIHEQHCCCNKTSRKTIWGTIGGINRKDSHKLLLCFGGTTALSVLLCYEHSRNIFQYHRISLASDWWGTWKQRLRRLLCAEKTALNRAADRRGGLFAPSHALWRKLFPSCQPFILRHVNKYPAWAGESVHASPSVFTGSQLFHLHQLAWHVKL